MVRVIIAGSRRFHDYNKMSSVLDKLLEDKNRKETEIISGCCDGADRIGELYAYNHGWKIVRFPADWKKYGKAAGPIRNEQMAKYAAEADRGMLIAFPIGESKGTRNMIKLAQQYGLDTYIEE